MDNRDKKKDSRLAPEWVRGQLEAVADWALDIAARVARDDQDDLDAIESVRSFVHDYFAGKRAEIPLADLLTTIAILISAIELDDELGAMSLLAPFHTFLELPSRIPAFVRCPGATQPVRRRRLPGRNVSITPLAA